MEIILDTVYHDGFEHSVTEIFYEGRHILIQGESIGMHFVAIFM